MKKILLGALGTLVVLIIIGAAVGGSHLSEVISATTTRPIILADAPSTPTPPAADKPADDGWGDATVPACGTKTDQFMTTATANPRVTNHARHALRPCQRDPGSLAEHAKILSTALDQQAQ
jgi:hypothetical protein